MDSDISLQIVQLRAFSRQQLLDLWQKLYRRAAPRGIRRELMVPFLSYKIQENAYGSLKPSTRLELRRIARGFEKSNESPKLRIRSKIKSGTRIVRQWRGQTHEVLVTETDYEYDGTRYRSLSEIARTITGVRWSGPAFFKLNNSPRTQGGRDD
jgi:hypothetical protein